MPSRFVSLLAFFALALSLPAAPLSGTKSIGPTGNYASLTAAIVDIQAQTVGGVLVLELQAAYVSSVETFPLTVRALNGASAVNTVTIRPASGAAGLSVTPPGRTLWRATPSAAPPPPTASTPPRRPLPSTRSESPAFSARA